MHLITHMDGKPYNCTMCGKSYSKSNHLVIQMQNPSWNKCDACTSGNFEFTFSTQLGMHLISHINRRPYHCTICGKSFSKSKHFVIHMKNLSLNKCDICTFGNFELTCLTQLRMHLINHMDGKPYYCTICGKSFSKLSDVKNRDCRLMRQECVNDVFTSRLSSRHNRGGL